MKSIILSALLIFGITEAASAYEIGENSAEDWIFNNGGEFGGAQGTVCIVKNGSLSGGPALYIEGNFGGGGIYAGVTKQIKDIPVFKVLRIRIKTSDMDRLTLRIQDGTKQVHQYQLSLKDTDEWQEIILKNDGKSKHNSFGGAKDGKWHDPVTGISFIVSKSNLFEGLNSGSIMISGFEFMDK